MADFTIASLTIRFFNRTVFTADTYLWDFGDGNTSTDQSPTHTYVDNGTYTVTLTATCGTTVSTVSKVLDVSGPPVIVTQPESQLVNPGDSVTFTVVATNATSYQWYGNGVRIDVATSTSYTVPSASSINVGTYTVDVINSVGDTLSDGAVLTLASNPAQSFDGFDEYTPDASGGSGTWPDIVHNQGDNWAGNGSDNSPYHGLD
jgi:PKD repeat protein